MSDELDADSLAKTCTEKEQVFASEYIVDLNATQAVWRSGCFKVSSEQSASVQASRLLSRANVQALIDVLRAQRSSRVGITQDSVLHELSLLSHSNILHYVVDDEGHVQLAAGAPEGATRAIQSVKRKKTVREDTDGNLTIVYDVELKLWDKPAPLKLMGRHVGLFADKIEHTGPGGGPIETLSRIERVIVKSDGSDTQNSDT